MSKYVRFISLTLACLLALAAAPVYALTAADYNEHDVLKLAAFFEQADAAGVKNGDKLFENYSPNDPSTWVGRRPYMEGFDYLADIITWNDAGRLSLLTLTASGLVGTLDLEGCEALAHLYCWDNSLTGLKLSGCTNLRYLIADKNRLTAPELDNIPYLIQLSLSFNRLASFDLSGLGSLNSLDLSDNLLTELDISGMEWLESLDCSNNKLTSLHVPPECHLYGLKCNGNELTELIIEDDYLELECSDNPFTSLDLSNVDMSFFECRNCPLQELRFKNNGHVISLYSGENGSIGAETGIKGGAGTGSPEEPKILAIAYPDEGYILDAWYDESGNWAYFYKEVDIYTEDMGDVSLTAVFEEGEEPPEPIDPNNTWDGTIAQGFAGGSGTEADPYLISSGQELALLAQTVNNGNNCSGEYFMLTEDIYLNDLSEMDYWTIGFGPANVWIPIGMDGEHYFSGCFDGAGHTIHGMHFTSEGSVHGLFGIIAGASIQNLNIEDSFVSGADYVGTVAAFAEHSSFIGCSADGYVYAPQHDYCGGIVGSAGWCNFESCSFAGQCDAMRGDYLGGIAGLAHASSFYGCSNSAKFTPVGTAEYNGGIVGFAEDNCVISNCVNYGDFECGGTRHNGGIAGSANDTDIINCTNYGNIFESDRCAGGIAGGAGSAEHVIMDCVNYGALTNFGEEGGIAGVASCALINCVNLGVVTSYTVTSSAGDSQAGGIVGWLGSTADGCVNYGAVKVEVRDNYYLGEMGGICGESTAGAELNRCVNNGMVTADYPNANGGGIIGKNKGSVISCVNNARLTGCYGGIASENIGSISQCLNNGVVYNLAENFSFAAGIVHMNSGAVLDCCNTGSIYAIKASGIASYEFTGGQETCCYNVGTLYGTEACCGAVLESYSDGQNIQNCYYLDTCCASSNEYGIALTHDMLTAEQSYEGFDFAEVWTMEGSEAYPYAELKSVCAMNCPIPGDVNGDGMLTANDALLVLRYALGLIDEIGYGADVDGNGLINANDALIILRAALGLASL